jgi:hypothetical protein
MKKTTLTLVFLFTFFILVAQKTELEVGKMYNLRLKNGNLVKARITGITDTQISCNLNGGPYPATYEKSEITGVETVKYPSTGSVGVGIGVAYGVIGFNGELSLLKYLGLSGGYGTTIVAGDAYSFGARLYATPSGSKWRPRISAHYGTNAFISVTGAREIQEKFKGLTLGAGVLGMFGEKRRTGFDIEIVYLQSWGNFEERYNQIISTFDEVRGTPNMGKVKILFGYRIAF